MMQVSTLYAHSLERQLVTRRSQNLIKNLSRSRNNSEQQQQQQQQRKLSGRHNKNTTLDFSSDVDLSEAGIIPLALERSFSCPIGECLSGGQSSSSLCDAVVGDGKAFDTESKEFTDRLCKLPSQCRGAHILGSPRRNSSSMTSMDAPVARISVSKLSQSTSELNVSPNVNLIKPRATRRSSLDPSSMSSSSVMNSALLNLTINDKKHLKKSNPKDKKDTKRIPSNFMYLGTWTTKQHCDRLLEQVKSGDVLEFNIKFHHHWGIVILPKSKKPTINSLELVHLKADTEGDQRVIKETLAQYWVDGVTARINNSRDVNKPPLSANEVVAASLKLTSQTYRIWQNSEQLIGYCRYGERTNNKQSTGDSARPGTLSKCVGLWLSMRPSKHSTPSASPAVRRKRFLSVNF